MPAGTRFFPVFVMFPLLGKAVASPRNTAVPAKGGRSSISVSNPPAADGAPGCFSPGLSTKNARVTPGCCGFLQESISSKRHITRLQERS